MKKVLLPLLMLLALSFLLATESAPSEVVGYVKYDCTITNDGNYAMVSLPFVCPYTTASQFAIAYGSLLSVNKWDPANQYWATAWTDGADWYDDFNIGSNDVLFLTLDPGSATLPMTRAIYTMGALPTSPVFTFGYDEVLGNYDTMFLPLNQSAVTTAMGLGNSIGIENVSSISYWDSTLQSWATAWNDGADWYDDFNVSIGTPLFVTVNAAGVTWPISSKAHQFSRSHK